MDSHSTSEDSADELLERVKVIVRCGTDSTGLDAFARELLVNGAVVTRTNAVSATATATSPSPRRNITIFI